MGQGELSVHTDVEIEFPARLLSVPHNELVVRLGHPIQFLCMSSGHVSVFFNKLDSRIL